MHGNVWEWCWDGYEKYDVKSPAVDPTGASGVPVRVIRGGGWFFTAVNTRASSRSGFASGSGAATWVFAWPEASRGLEEAEPVAPADGGGDWPDRPPVPAAASPGKSTFGPPDAGSRTRRLRAAVRFQADDPRLEAGRAMT